MATESPLSLLPVEIVREILERAALNDKAVAATLDCISQTVRHWIGPILYYKVLLLDTETFILFVEMLRNVPSVATGITRDQAFYRQAIQYLCIRDIRLPAHFMGPIGTICDNVRTLDIDESFVAGRDTPIHTQQLVTSGIPNRKYYLFSNLTHLWLTNTPQWFAHDLQSYNGPYPLSLLCVALPFRISELRQIGRRTTIKNILLLQNLKIFVINLLERYHALSTLMNDAPELTPVEVWTNVLQDLPDDRIFIRKGSRDNEEVSALRQFGDSLWKRAVREGVRHPDFQNEPIPHVPDP